MDHQNTTNSVPPVIEPVVPDEAVSQHQARPWAFAILLVGVVCMGMGQTIVFAVLPPIARNIGIADFQVGAIFMTSAIFWVLFGPFWGRLSDQWGRRPLILIGIAGFTISMVLFATSIRLGMAGVLSGAGLYVLMISMRSIYGIVGSAQPSAAQAYIADRTTPEKRTKGLASMGAAFGIGTTFGPAFAGITVAFGPLAPLYAVACLGALAWIAVFFLLPENNPPKKRQTPPRVKLTDPRTKPFLIYGLISGAISAVPIQLIGFYFIDALSLSETDALTRVSIALTASALASLFAQTVLVGKLSLRPGTLILLSPIFFIIANVLFASASNQFFLTLGAAMSGLGAGMGFPGFAAAASLAVNQNEQGATAGLANAASASGFILAPLFGFALYDIDIRAPFMFTAVLAVSLLTFCLSSEKIRALNKPA